MVHLRSIGAVLRIAVVSLICGVVPTDQAVATTFSDAGTFNTSHWSETILGGGDVVDTRMATGGNPGELIQLETIPMGGSIAIGVYLNSDATWDTSTQGEIDTIDMNLDVRLISSMFNHPDGQAYGIAVEQDGEIYRSGFPVTGQDLSWSSRSILGVRAAGFTGLNVDGSSNLGIGLDFSTTGSTITFGFMVANSGGAPISGTTAGYDNWSLTVNQAEVPEPATLGLLCLGLSFIAIRRRR